MTHQPKKRSGKFTLTLMTVRKWHWMSAALCFVCLLLFAVTGITLHHSKILLPKPIVSTVEGDLPQDMLVLINLPAEKKAPVVAAPIYEWFARKNIFLHPGRTEIKDGKLILLSGRPGMTVSLSLELETGHYKYETNDRGWMGYFNDLHKGKNTGDAWVYFIDLFAIACIIFSVTGFILLQRYANTRAKTWPLLIAGFLLPVFFMMFLIHS